MAIDKERRHWVSLPNVLALLGTFGTIAAVWGALAADNADTKRRVSTLEQGETKTYALIKETGNELKREIREQKEGQNLILQEIRSMQAVERERERARRERNGR